MTYEPTADDIEALAEVLHDRQKNVGNLYLRWSERPEGEGEGPWAGWRDVFRDEARELLATPAMQKVLASAVNASKQAEWDRKSAWLEAKQERERKQDAQDWAY